MTSHNQEFQACIRECSECARICLDTATGHCLETGGEHVAAPHLRLMLDCADICATSARFMIRGSPRHALTCEVCAEVCTRCAEDCERFQDEHMRSCAEACRRCAAACHEMAGAAA